MFKQNRGFLNQPTQLEVTNTIGVWVRARPKKNGPCPDRIPPGKKQIPRFFLGRPKQHNNRARIPPSPRLHFRTPRIFLHHGGWEGREGEGAQISSYLGLIVGAFSAPTLPPQPPCLQVVGVPSGQRHPGGHPGSLPPRTGGGRLHQRLGLRAADLRCAPDECDWLGGGTGGGGAGLGVVLLELRCPG